MCAYILNSIVRLLLLLYGEFHALYDRLRRYRITHILGTVSTLTGHFNL